MNYFEEIKKELTRIQKITPRTCSVDFSQEGHAWAQLEERDEEGHHLVELDIWHNTELGWLGKIDGNYLVEDFVGSAKEALEKFKTAQMVFFSN